LPLATVEARRILEAAMVTTASIGRRQRGARRRWGVGAALLVAGVAHAVALTAAGAAGVGRGWGGMGPDDGAPTRLAKPERPLQPNCAGDAVLAAAPRVLLCASPFVDDSAVCLREVDTAMRSELLGCKIEDLPSVAFSLTPIDAATLKQIDPEPLLEALTEQKQRAFEAAQQLALDDKVAEAVKARVQPPTAQEQVAEVARPDHELAPDRARFVSEYNTKVDRQTVARGSDREPIARRSQDEAVAPQADPRPASSSKPPDARPPSDHPDAPPTPGQLAMRTPGAITPSEIASDAHTRGSRAGADQAAADGLRSRRGDGLIDQREVQPEPSRGEGGGGGGGAPRVDLRPTQDVLESAVGGGSVDHLDDVAEGDETALNSRQWIHATFFNRMKRAVHQTWDPVSIWRRHDPTGAVYGLKNRITRVRVSLTPSGQLAQVIVVSPSGVDLLDAEAARAFRAAAPFPHPPGALVGDDGLITFDFGFYLQIDGGRADWNIFRP